MMSDSLAISKSPFASVHQILVWNEEARVLECLRNDYCHREAT